jgi:protein SCO1/2
MIDRRAVLAGALAAGCTPSPESDLAQLGRGLDNVTLRDQTGADVRWADLKGQPRALFFGFTNCPVICPVTVYELTAALDAIGAPVEAIGVQFVTIDPERDTPERLAAYFAGFGPRVRAFVASQETTARIAEAFKVTYVSTPTSSGYTIDHTATVFLLDASARAIDVVAYGTAPNVLAERLRALL